jgi:pimeloyl-ACP methyl ester carboxylesterase
MLASSGTAFEHGARERDWPRKAPAGCATPSTWSCSSSNRTKGFDDMPVEFRELSPSYRAMNPEGVRLWLELHRKAVTGNRIGQKPANEITWAALRGMKVPTLLITGDADLILPPPLLRLFGRNIPNSETAVVAEAGHSVYWEQPGIFNRIVLDFIGRYCNSGYSARS